MTNVLDFHSEMDASRYLLRESTGLLLQHGVDFVVVGGWAAYLFHSARYGHPGTFDVDILLNERSLDDGTFDHASRAFISNGYLGAPKNSFQAHKILSVGSKNLVYHVDFLNEREPAADALELVQGTGPLKSIYTESMDAVFKYHGFREIAELPKVRFPSVETFIATKAPAAKVKKRNRDAFDIFVTAIDQSPAQLKYRWQRLVDEDVLFQAANSALVTALDEGKATEKIIAVLKSLGHYSAPSLASAREIRAAFDFLVR